MKKLLFVFLFLLITANCFAEPKVMLAEADGTLCVPTLSGTTVTASSAILATNNQILPFGTTTSISKVLISVPVGEAYIGSSTVTGGTGLILDATMPILTIDCTNLNQIYWTGKVNQKINFIVIQ